MVNEVNFATGYITVAKWLLPYDISYGLSQWEYHKISNRNLSMILLECFVATEITVRKLMGRDCKCLLRLGSSGTKSSSPEISIFVTSMHRVIENMVYWQFMRRDVIALHARTACVCWSDRVRRIRSKVSLRLEIRKLNCR